MKFLILLVYTCVLTLVSSISNAQEDNNPLKSFIMAQGITNETYVACVNEFTNKKLDPVRNKIPFWYLNVGTDSMRNNTNKPTAQEKEALQAYLNANIVCDALSNADLFPNDEKKQNEKNISQEKSLKKELQPLIDGKITYAEYSLRQDQKIKTDLKSLGLDPNIYDPKPVDPKRYQNFIESWLGPYKVNYPENSPWWSLYYYAVGIAKEVDKGKISDENAAKLIEVKRIKVNEEIAALSAPKIVTLNCSVTLSGGERRDMVLAIDYTNLQVNGYKAEFSENIIRWTVPDPVNPDGHYTLNRLSGFLNIGNYQFSSLISGYCAPATSFSLKLY